MLFSFLICAHIDHPYVSEAILSMINQDYEDEYEIVLIANNCTDDFFLKLVAITQTTEKIILERTSIGQLAFNLNYGINIAKGEYIVRMDADDVCMKSRLTETLRILNDYNYPDVLAGCAVKTNSEGAKLGVLGKPGTTKALSQQLPFKNPIIHPATAIKKESLLRVRGYLGGLNSEDLDLWLRMDRLGMKIVAADFIAIKHRISEHQVKGSRIAYADAAGLRLREALFRGSFVYFLGALFVMFKFLVLSAKGQFLRDE